MLIIIITGIKTLLALLLEQIFHDLQSWEYLRIESLPTLQKQLPRDFSLGLNYYLDSKYTFNGNFSWNKLNKQIDDL